MDAGWVFGRAKVEGQRELAGGLLQILAHASFVFAGHQQHVTARAGRRALEHGFVGVDDVGPLRAAATPTALARWFLLACGELIRREKTNLGHVSPHTGSRPCAGALRARSESPPVHGLRYASRRLPCPVDLGCTPPHRLPMASSQQGLCHVGYQSCLKSFDNPPVPNTLLDDTVLFKQDHVIHGTHTVLTAPTRVL